MELFKTSDVFVIKGFTVLYLKRSSTKQPIIKSAEFFKCKENPSKKRRFSK